MSQGKNISASVVAGRLGTSVKALRLYEEHGLVSPGRNTSGWRVYTPADVARAAEIVGLRDLGLSIGQIAKVLEGEASCLREALAARQAELEGQVHRIEAAVKRLRNLRGDMDCGRVPSTRDLAELRLPQPAVSFKLPWPWDGEVFELHGMGHITYITGPLGSGKTKLAERIAQALPNATFLRLLRLKDDCAASQAGLRADPVLRQRVDEALSWLAGDGAEDSPRLSAILAAICANDILPLVIDMPEHGLNSATQEALMAFLRRRGAGTRQLVLLTRSSAILDLADIGDEETVILCPANHGVPMIVRPYPGATGYEAVSTCLASPEVRKRTEGVIAMRPHVLSEL